MSEPFIGEIRMFAGNFAPRGYALCEGQLLAVAQNTALFSLLGTTYGGDGRTTYALPDLRGRIPVHYGSGPALSNRVLGEKSGRENETLTVNQLPNHSHVFNASTDPAGDLSPIGNSVAAATGNMYGSTLSGTQSSLAITAAGGTQSHTNMMPTLCINFIIALSGIFPSRF